MVIKPVHVLFAVSLGIGVFGVHLAEGLHAALMALGVGGMAGAWKWGV